MRIWRKRTARTGRGPVAAVEALEGRQLLAGDVLVAYDAATNTIDVTGDSAANDILISGNLNVGYTVTGLAGTTVNGGTAAVTIVPTGGQRANFDVDLGGGNDAVEFNNFAALAVEVDAGSGDDDVTFSNVTAFNGIDIGTASGDDDVSLDYVDIHEGLSINTASGDDTVEFGSTVTGVTVFSGDVHVQGASGENKLTGRSNLHTSAGQKVQIKKFKVT